MKIKYILGHFSTITKHKWIVFKLSIKAGIPFRGLIHDLSKYSFEEFSEGVRYYQGNRSPITKVKEVKGYSKAWLHHKGKNKHHHEYWYDYDAPDKTPLMPYKYFVEMICDNLAAGITYQKENWNDSYQLSYWLDKKEKIKINKKVELMLTEVYEEVSKKRY